MIFDFETFMVFVLCAMAVATVSLTLTRSKGARWLRDKLPQNMFWQGLFGCPYCMAHWVALVPLWISDGSWLALGILYFASVALATIFMGIMSKLMLMGESEIKFLQEEYVKCRKELSRLGNSSSA